MCASHFLLYTTVEEELVVSYPALNFTGYDASRAFLYITVKEGLTTMTNLPFTVEVRMRVELSSTVV